VSAKKGGPRCLLVFFHRGGGNVLWIFWGGAFYIGRGEGGGRGERATDH